MPNKIINRAPIKNITTNGKSISIKYATKTESWSRPVMAQSVKENFSKATEKTDVPENAAAAILALVSFPKTQRDLYLHNP